MRRLRRNDRFEHRRSGHRLASAALLLTGVLPFAACTTVPAAPSPALPVAVADQLRSTGSIPPDDEQAIRTTIERLNASAGGSVADQQAALTAAVEPDSAQALADCPAVTTTLHFEPVYPGLRLSPEWTPKQGELAGTVYALPTLITIFTGNRVTTTDLTTLHLGVAAGEAFLTPLCVS
jgi:hypothetical protein